MNHFWTIRCGVFCWIEFDFYFPLQCLNRQKRGYSARGFPLCLFLRGAMGVVISSSGSCLQVIDDSALGSHLRIPAKCSSLHDVCFILATFHLQKNQAICWKQKEGLLVKLPKRKTRILIETIFFYLE